MHCNSCAQRIEENLRDHVKNISVSYSKGEASIDFHSGKISENTIKDKINKLGYKVSSKNKTNNIK